MWYFLNGNYLQGKGKGDTRSENFSPKDPNKYHYLTSVVWLYNSFGRKGEQKMWKEIQSGLLIP